MKGTWREQKPYWEKEKIFTQMRENIASINQD